MVVVGGISALAWFLEICVPEWTRAGAVRFRSMPGPVGGFGIGLGRFSGMGRESQWGGCLLNWRGFLGCLAAVFGVTGWL